MIPLMPLMSETGAFWYGFVNIALSGVLNGASAAAIFGMAGPLPPLYMGSIMIGQGLAGVMCNILKASLLLILGNEKEIISIIFYSLGAFFFLTCAFLYSVLIKHPFYIHHRK